MTVQTIHILSSRLFYVSTALNRTKLFRTVNVVALSHYYLDMYFSVLLFSVCSLQ